LIGALIWIFLIDPERSVVDPFVEARSGGQ